MTEIDNDLRSRLDRAEERERKRDDLLARIDERVKAGNDEADHRHRNLSQSIAGLTPRSEHDALAKRVTDVEGTLKWLLRSLVAINTAIAAGMAAVGKKLGVWS
jgi:predicted phage gp36 major capsid-like protein